MRDKEQIEDDLFGDDRLVKGDRNNFSMPGDSGADGFVVRVPRVAAGITGDDLGHAVGFLVDGIKAPEAASAQYKCFHVWFNVWRAKMIPSRPYESAT